MTISGKMRKFYSKKVKDICSFCGKNMRRYIDTKTRTYEISCRECGVSYEY